MQKTLLTLAVLSLAAATPAFAAPEVDATEAAAPEAVAPEATAPEAATPEVGAPEASLHPFKDGRYTVTTGYEHSNAKSSNEIKQSSDIFTLNGRADIPLAQQHAIRAELGYARKNYDGEITGITVVDGAKANNINLYAGYLYSLSGFKQGGLRVGGGLGYSYTANKARDHRISQSLDIVDTNSSILYLKAQVEYEQALGGGWSITPWGDVTVSLRHREKIKWSQSQVANMPDDNYKGSSYSLGLGVDAQKQLTPNMTLTFGPYYRYLHAKSHAHEHAGVSFDSATSRENSFGIRAGLRF